MVKYESFDPNNYSKGDCSDSWIFGLNYYIKGDDLKIMLDYMLGTPKNLPYDAGRIMARIQVCF